MQTSPYIFRYETVQDLCTSTELFTFVSVHTAVLDSALSASKPAPQYLAVTGNTSLPSNSEVLAFGAGLKVLFTYVPNTLPPLTEY